MRNAVSTVVGSCLIVSICSVASKAEDVVTAPTPAAERGFTKLTFSSSFNANDVQLGNETGSETKWFLWNLFRHRAKPERILLNEDKGATLLGDTTGPGGEIATITVFENGKDFKGVAFGGGGYFEATFKFDPQKVIDKNFSAWPGWWSMSLEHILENGGSRWPGQSETFERFIEVDFFEYDMAREAKSGRLNYYGGTIHAWYGVLNETCIGRVFCDLIPPNSVNRRETPKETDFSAYHSYGFLWIPATDTSLGSAEWYFDHAKIGAAVTWTKYDGSPPPARSPWAYSVLDESHLVLILGTGVDEPLSIKSVEVWQTSDAKNLRR